MGCELQQYVLNAGLQLGGFFRMINIATLKITCEVAIFSDFWNVSPYNFF